MPDVVVGRETLGTENPIASSEDRDRLTDAMTRAAVECGYGAVDIEQIAIYAGLTADDFRQQFASKDKDLAGPVARSVTAPDAAAQLSQAAQDLAGVYRTSYGKIDCS